MMSRILFHRPAAAALAVCIAAGLAAADIRPGAAAQAQGRGQGPDCNVATLRGDYGVLISGSRPLPGGQRELFAATALITYDGHGGFTQVDNSNGQVSGAVLDRPGSGTYHVNADCTGTATLLNAGVPFPIVTSFVIVDRGNRVLAATMSPAGAITTAESYRK